MLNHSEPLTPQHVYSAIRVQRALVRKRRNDKFKALTKFVANENDARTPRTTTFENEEKVVVVSAQADTVGAYVNPKPFSCASLKHCFESKFVLMWLLQQLMAGLVSKFECSGECAVDD